ncbi:MAG: hypothetical protein EPO11_03880 [Gammaproteobacteria bacterium]|nr:MAG: hypothetical protein EPO11_03880 [Gammaproteobacteria bacterium]
MLDTILPILQYAVKRARDLIQYSANLPDPFSTTANRSIALNLVRTTAGDQPELSQQEAYAQWQKRKEFIREIKSLNLDLSANQEDQAVLKKKITLKSLNNKKATLKELASFMFLLPKDVTKSRSYYRYLETQALRAVRYNIGNCDELSACVFFLLVEGFPEFPALKKKIPVERVGTKEKQGFMNHATVIVNRDPNTVLEDIHSWNDDAVICDGWTGEVITKKQLLSADNGKYAVELLVNLSEREFTPLIPNEEPRYRYFMGENNNSYIHTPEWESKNDGSKFWKPYRLVDLKKRPAQIDQQPAPCPWKGLQEINALMVWDAIREIRHLMSPETQLQAQSALLFWQNPKKRSTDSLTTKQKRFRPTY